MVSSGESYVQVLLLGLLRCRAGLSSLAWAFSLLISAMRTRMRSETSAKKASQPSGNGGFCDFARVGARRFLAIRRVILPAEYFLLLYSIPKEVAASQLAIENPSHLSVKLTCRRAQSPGVLQSLACHFQNKMASAPSASTFRTPDQNKHPFLHRQHAEETILRN